VPKIRKIRIFARSEASIGRKTSENELSQRDNVAHEPPRLSKGCNPATVTRTKRVSRKRAILARRPGLLHESGGTIEFFVIPACPPATKKVTISAREERTLRWFTKSRIPLTIPSPSVALLKNSFRPGRFALRIDWPAFPVFSAIRVPMIARGGHMQDRICLLYGITSRYKLRTIITECRVIGLASPASLRPRRTDSSMNSEPRLTQSNEHAN